MTEYNYFCWSKKYNDENSFQQKRYRVFNVEVGEEEYNQIKKIYHKLEINPDDNNGVRFQNAFKKMWDKLSDEERQEYIDIPHFNAEGFEFITGINVKTQSLSGKKVKIRLAEGTIVEGEIIE